MRGEYLTPQQVLEYMRPGQAAHVQSFYRWVKQGVLAPDGRRVRLKATNLAGKMHVHILDLRRFIEAMNPERKSELSRRSITPPPALAPHLRIVRCPDSEKGTYPEHDDGAPSAACAERSA